MDIAKGVKALSMKNKRRRTPVFIHGSSERQYELAFPKHVIDYIIQNPKSPKQWKKLIQTCKLFFDKNPIVVIPCLYFYIWENLQWKTCSSGICDHRHNNPLNFLDKPFKLWITEHIDVIAINLSTQFIPQLFKCDATKIRLYDNFLRLDELCFLTSNVVNATFSSIRNKNGKKYAIEEIMEILPASLETIEFYLAYGDFTFDTFEKLAKMEHLRKLKKMKLHGLVSSLSFNFDALFKFVLENKQTWFAISLHDPSASEEYIAAVKNASKIIRNEDYGIYRRPWIHFNQIDLVKIT